MLKNIFVVLTFCVLFLFGTPIVYGQEFNAQKAYSDYQYQLSVYQQAFSEFQDAKTFYLSNPTLQLKGEVRQKTQKMLKERDNLMAVYLTAIRLQIVESKGFNNDEKGAIFGKIDPEVVWYKNHITNYLDSDEPVDLFNKSDESKSRYETNTTLVIYESLFDIGLSQEIGLRLAHQQIYSDLKNYINDQVALGRLKIDPFNRWLNDTDSVLQLLQKNEVSAAAKIQAIYKQNYGSASSYNDAVQILVSSVNPLTQLNSYLTEMLTSIQNQMK